jgi:hypothetical protein
MRLTARRPGRPARQSAAFIVTMILLPSLLASARGKEAASRATNRKADSQQARAAFRRTRSLQETLGSYLSNESTLTGELSNNVPTPIAPQETNTVLTDVFTEPVNAAAAAISSPTNSPTAQPTEQPQESSSTATIAQAQEATLTAGETSSAVTLSDTESSTSAETASESDSSDVYQTTSIINDKGEMVRQVECTSATYDTPSEPQLVKFLYAVYLSDKADLLTKIQEIDFRVVDAVVKEFLTCNSESTQAYLVQAVESLPVDKEQDTCQPIDDGSLCYLVDAAFTLDITYPEQRRLANVMDDQDMVKELGDFLRNLFDGDVLAASDDEIYNLAFRGFTNIAEKPTFGGEAPNTDTSTSSDKGVVAVVEQDNSLDQPKKAGGSTTLAIAGFAMLAIIALVVYRQRTKKDLTINRSMSGQESLGEGDELPLPPIPSDEAEEDESINVLSDNKRSTGEDEGYELDESWLPTREEEYTVPAIESKSSRS